MDTVPGVLSSCMCTAAEGGQFVSTMIMQLFTAAPVRCKTDQPAYQGA